MKEKFKNRKIDSDTKIISESYLTLDGFNCLHEKWVWEATKGESIIFLTDEIGDMNQKDLEDIVNKSGLVKKYSLTYSKGKEFTYVNFNFSVS